jgi:hypothetical protein
MQTCVSLFITSFQQVPSTHASVIGRPRSATRGDAVPATMCRTSNGLLTGKYLPENKSAGGEATRLDSEMMKGFASVDKSGLVSLDDSGIRVVREVIAIAKEMGITAAQVALAWPRHRSVPAIPIIGARKLVQLEDNLKSLEITFSPEQLRRLDSVSSVPMGFPGDLLNGAISGSLFGGMRDQIIA